MARNAAHRDRGSALIYRRAARGAIIEHRSTIAALAHNWPQNT